MQNMMVKKAILENIFAENPIFLTAAHRWPDQVFLSIDSRLPLENSIFFAIKGDLNDGHDFIDDAIKSGASLVVAQRQVDATVPLIIVPDSLKTFSDIAHRHLMSMPAFRIGLTGSNGKTTVKEMIRAALSAVLGAEAVYANEGTLNNHFGVPISALQLRPCHKVAIFEMGMNHEGEIRELCQIVKPDLGLITNVGVAHEGNFRNGVAGIQAAKGEIFEAVEQKMAVINFDDERVVAEAKRHNFAQTLRFGSSNTADIWLAGRDPYDIKTGLQRLRIGHREGTTLSFGIPMPGIHHAKNALAALAVVKALGLDLQKAAQGLASMITALGRMSLSELSGCLLINDAYNANPASMKAGVMACLEFEAPRRIAVVGSMGELGNLSDRYHFELGQLLAEHFHTIFICGELAYPVLKGAENRGFKAAQLLYKKTPEELIEPLRAIMHHHDLIFIKGSKSAKMQVVARALLEKS